MESAGRQILIAAAQAFDGILAIAVILLDQHILRSASLSLFEHAVKVDIALADDVHAATVSTVLQMDAGNAAGQLFEALRRICAAHLRPIGIKGNAHQLSRDVLADAVEDAHAVDLLEFLIVVVVHEVLSVLLEYLCRFTVVFDEALIGHALFRIKGIPAKTYIVAAEHIVLLGDLRRLSNDAIRLGMRNNALQAVLLQFSIQPFRLKGTGSGNLNRAVADISNLLQRLSKAFQRLAGITDRKKLCTDFHHDLTLLENLAKRLAGCVKRLIIGIVAISADCTLVIFALKRRKAVKNLQMGLQRQRTSTHRHILSDNARNLTDALTRRHNIAVRQRILDVQIFDKGLQHFPACPCILTALDKVRRIIDSLQFRERLMKLEASAGHIAINALFIFVAQIDSASLCRFDHRAHLIKYLAPEFLGRTAGRNIEGEHADILRTQNVGNIQRMAELVQMSRKVVLFNIDLADRRADRPYLKTRFVHACADLFCLVRRQIRNILTIRISDLEAVQTVSMHRGNLTADLRTRLICKCINAQFAHNTHHPTGQRPYFFIIIISENPLQCNSLFLKEAVKSYKPIDSKRRSCYNLFATHSPYKERSMRMFSLKFISAGTAYSTFTEMVPAPCLRRTFTMDTPVQSASITICGLGFYEFYINGARLTKGLLAPYISNPDDILYYDAYDIAPYLREGKNTIAIMLGNGMLNCPGGDIWDMQLARYRSAPKAALSFEAALTDGSTLAFEADEQFVCAPSPIYYDDLRIGEFYDARNEHTGWTLPDFDDSDWFPAMHAETPRGECRLCTAEPIVVTGELKPITLRRASMGVVPDFRDTLPVVQPTGVEGQTEGWLYDFGVNAAGNIRLKIHGQRGQKIVMQFAEELDADGNLDLRGMNFLPQALNHRDIYICKGDGEELYTPHFAYHGFRYCLVLGLEDTQATPELLTYLVMNSDLRSMGDFSCSDPILNQIQQCTRVSDLANFYYFPTDCPHREKNGWTADAALSTEQMLLNFAPENSYREWLNNIRKAQREDGALPGIVPTSGWGFDWGNGPAWDCALVILPYYIWRLRGDTSIIRENAAAIMRYLHYITTRRDEDGLIHIGLGDWCHCTRAGADDFKAPLELTDTLMCMDISRKAATLFAAVGMESQRAFAMAVHEEFRSAGRRHLIDHNTLTALGCCQSSQAMAIYYDLFDNAEKPEAFRVLLRLIEQNEGLMDVGVLGARILFRVLSEFGRSDLAYDMIVTERYPSYGYWMRHGATSLWENFHPEGANPSSHNHHFWGDVSAWMIEYLAGICLNPNENDVSCVHIRPRFVEKLNHISAHHTAPAGRISSEWTRDGEAILLRITIPEGCHGRILLEDGWQFDHGHRTLPARTGEYRIIPAGRLNTRYYG